MAVSIWEGSKAERVVNALELVAEAQATTISKIEDWYTIKRIVDRNMAKTMLPVGTQISDIWKKTASDTGYTAPWDVVHHYSNGDMALNWHYAIPDGVPFDEPEAIYYANADGLAAGQYYITVGSAYGDGWKVGAHISFTLSEDMVEGDQLVINFGTNYALNPSDGRTWNVYAKGSTTSKQNGVTSEGMNGTELGTIGATNAHRPEGQLNAISRCVYGYGRWSQSAIRQWFNSAADAGAWWTPQNNWDRPPAVATTLRGFLAGYTDDFLQILKPYPVVTALNTQEGFSETSETTYDKIFLPSLQEMYINPQLANVEGEAWDYNKALAEESGLTGKFAQGGTYTILRKFNVSNVTSPVYVWLRSCFRGNAGSAWCVYSSGGVGSNAAYNANRGCPACIIQKSA